MYSKCYSAKSETDPLASPLQEGLEYFFLRGGGGLRPSKIKKFKGKYDAKLEFSEGGGLREKPLLWGEVHVWIFCGTAH